MVNAHHFLYTEFASKDVIQHTGGSQNDRLQQEAYKACMALLKLTDKYPVQRLENDCRKALSYTPQPSYKIIQSILKSGQDQLLADAPKEKGKKPSQYSFTRGADYYRRDK